MVKDLWRKLLALAQLDQSTMAVDFFNGGLQLALKCEIVRLLGGQSALQLMHLASKALKSLQCILLGGETFKKRLELSCPLS